ncbi:hypothetical protein PG991_014055 [Apiospora marii]|uniref:Protein kinase domain-containing protein n=1 Tax=Apiospora marii TaxID=335849 RepID=A0ABR1R842_9PEZI
MADQNTPGIHKSGDEAERKIITNKLNKFQAYRSQRYSDVTAILLYWEADDLGLEDEIKDLNQLFGTSFGYTVLEYRIPSKNPDMSLSRYLMDTIQSHGQEDKLLIVYYGGHGARALGDPKDKSFIWAAKKEGGPEVDWSLIQPQFLLSQSDVVVFLDCCFAGGALRGRSVRRIEYLCAVDMDNATASGRVTMSYPSFTKVLIKEMRSLLNENQDPTLSELGSRMRLPETGLMRQPYYVVMGGGPPGSPSIRLPRLIDDMSSDKPPVTGVPISTAQELYIRLSYHGVLEDDTTACLVHWLTRGSPSFLFDVEHVTQILSDAKGARQIGKGLLVEKTVLSQLSKESYVEAERLVQEFTSSLSAPSLSGPSYEGVEGFLQDIRQKSDAIITFMEDSMAHMSSASLTRLGTSDVSERLRERISIKLRQLLVGNEDSLPEISANYRVRFNEGAKPKQRFHRGTKRGAEVLVEYVYYNPKDKKHTERAQQQVKRMAVLHAEPKSQDFLDLRSPGFFHDTISGERFGLVYELPSELKGRPFWLLSDLMDQVRFVPLEDRIGLGTRLGNALLKIHAIGWYHKNIKSNNVLIFAKSCKVPNPPRWEDLMFESPYLLGFDCSRPSEVESRKTPDFTSANNVYRHPERWGNPTQFEGYHDVYAMDIVRKEVLAGLQGNMKGAFETTTNENDDPASIPDT